MKPIQIEAILSGFSTKADLGVSLRFSTNEVRPEDVLALMQMKNAFGWLMFRPNEFMPSDIPAEDAEDTNKTPSKRLRSVLFVLWKQRGSKGDFEEFYRQKVELVIQEIKSKLD